MTLRTAAIDSVRQAERRALARDLHDGLGQQLVVLQMNLRLARESVAAGEPAATLLEDSIALVGGLHRDIRGRALELHSSLLEDLGLVPALRSHSARVAASTRATVLFETVDFASSRRWPVDIESQAFRIAQEALANALRHSHAGRIAVYAAVNDRRLEVRVHDDGIGFDRAAVRGRRARRSLGLASMSERARLAGGRLNITSAPGRGTTVTVRFMRPRTRAASRAQ
jgi:signal transduction histidine kinase